MTNTFFEESRQQSKVKTAIVEKYFDAWSRVILSTQKHRSEKRIAYIDLFAGPGRYADGTISTPLRVLEKAVNDNHLRSNLVTIFNDKDERNTNSLREAIQGLPNVEALRYQPKIHTHEVGDEIAKIFEEMELVPTLFFVDPWGYKGLSLRLVDSVLKDWGCDCIFFFNYNRISMGLTNEAVREPMDALFGQERVEEMRVNLSQSTPQDRELSIVDQLCQAIRSSGPRYVLPFRFRDERGTRTSHLIGVN